MKKNLVYVICDGSNNSVFESQVILPLVKKIQKDPLLSVNIISFESKLPFCYKSYERITFHFIQSTYLSLCLSLCIVLPLAKKVQAILNEYNIKEYTCIARGPLAGAIAQKIKNKKCQKLTIQARGLLAEEALYSAFNGDSFINFIRYFFYKRIEKNVYSQNNYILESVTKTIEIYLKENYNTHAQDYLIATHDIPSILSKEQHKIFRNRYRKKLNIPDNEIVYVYNGSYKSWQLPEETIAYFKKRGTGTLLILTPDIEPFQNLTKTLKIKNVIIKKVNPSDVINVLCVADYGFLLRDQHIINWVSRPTKALEYQAAHVKIIHNDTVNYLL